MQSTIALLAVGSTLAAAQFVPPPSVVRLTTTKSAVLPVLPPGFTGVDTLEGAIISKAAINSSYTPLGGAAVTQTNLPAATYVATLPSVAFDALTGTTIAGSISISSVQGASGVTVTANFTGFPNITQYGPFGYHIHDSPVPTGGNCTSTLAHFDVTNAGEYYTCNTATPQLCQTGDLAGKHGKINATTFSTSYVEPFLSTNSSSPYFIGTKSITIHTSNTTRLTCANFVLRAANSTSTTSTGSTNTSSTTTTSTTKPATYTGAASKTVAGGALVGLAAIFGLML